MASVLPQGAARSASSLCNVFMTTGLNTQNPLLTKALSGQEERLCGLKEDVCPCSSRHKELCLQEDTIRPAPS